MASSNKRREMDIMKLMMSDYKVEMKDDGGAFMVLFHGPQDTLYEGGIWKVLVQLPRDYPYRSPSIGFRNKIYHPNVDETSGSVCLDVINQTWSPMYDLLNVFDVFLPQLLAYPNPSDPLNSEAAGLSIREPEKYREKVRDYVRKYATTADARKDSVSSCSSVSTTSSSGSDSGPESGRPPAQEPSHGGADHADVEDMSSLSGASDEEDDMVLDL